MPINDIQRKNILDSMRFDLERGHDDNGMPVTVDTLYKLSSHPELQQYGLADDINSLIIDNEANKPLAPDWREALQEELPDAGRDGKEIERKSAAYGPEAGKREMEPVRVRDASEDRMGAKPPEKEVGDIYDELGLPVGEPKVGAKYLFKTADIAFGGPIVRTVMDVEPVTEAESEAITEPTKGTVRGALTDIGAQATVAGERGIRKATGEPQLTPGEEARVGELGGKMLSGGAELALYGPAARGMVGTGKMAGAAIRKTEQVFPELAEIAGRQLASERGLIGGVGAVEPPTGLSKAKEMAKGKVDKKTIWQETGWMKGKEGKWRFEIDDAAAKLSKDFIEGVKSEKVFNLGGPFKLKDVLEHQELFRQYPKLQDVRVYVDNLGLTRGEFYDSVMGPYLKLNSNLFKPHRMEESLNEAKSVLLHEIQHAIQRKETFAIGGSPNVFTTGYLSPTRQEEILSLASKIGKWEKNHPESLEKFIKENYFTSKEVAQARKMLDDYGPQKIASMWNESTSRRTYEAYRQLAGEVEARDVQARIPFTKHERKTTPLYSSAEYPEEQWIVREETAPMPMAATEKPPKELQNLAEEANKYPSSKEFVRAHRQAHLTDLSAPEKHRWGRAISPYRGEPYTDIEEILTKQRDYLEDIRYTYPQIYRKIIQPGKKITIYRAIPRTGEDLLAYYEQQAKQVLKTGKIPQNAIRPEAFRDKSEYYEYISDQIARLKALPEGERKVAKLDLKIGDYVALDRNYAVMHGESVLMGEQGVPYRVVSKSVPKQDVVWGEADWAEWAYSPKNLRDYAESLEEFYAKVTTGRIKNIIGKQLKSETGAITFKEKGLPIETKVAEPPPPTKPPEKLPKYAGSVNLEQITDKDSIKKFVFQTYEREKQLINKARRGKMTLDQIEGSARRQLEMLAAETGTTPKNVFKKWQKGQAFNAEEITKLRILNNASANNISNLARQAIGGSDKDLVELAEAIQRHIEIQTITSAAATEWGRTGAALRIKVGPEDIQQKYIKRMLEQLGGREITEGMAKAIAEAADTGPEAVHKFLRDMAKPNFKDMAFEYWINSLLSGPTTHLVNNASNTLVFLSKFPEKAIGATVEAGRAALTRTARERFFGEIPKEAFGVWSGVKQGTRKALNAWKYEVESGGLSKLERTGKSYGQAIPSKKIKIGERTVEVGGKQIRWPGRALMAEDEFFKAINYETEIRALAYRQASMEGLKGSEKAQRIGEILTDPSPRLMDKAQGEMLYRVFQKELGPGGKWITEGRSKVPGLRYIIPFVRTPLNIAKFGLERTPLNFLRIASKAYRGELKGGALSDEIARAAMGTMIGITVAMYAKEGLITGKGPENKGERDTRYRLGWQPYSINWDGVLRYSQGGSAEPQEGDHYYSFGRLEPLGMVLGLAADYSEISDRATDQELGKIVSDIQGAITQNLTNKTFLRGLTETINALDDPQRYGEHYLKNILGTVVPTGVAQIARATDPYFRRTDDIPTAIKARIPEKSKEILPRLDLWGRPIERPMTGIAALSPVQVRKSKDDPVDKEMLRLRISKRPPMKKQWGIELTPEQHYDFAKISGEMARERLERFIIANKDAWTKRDDDNKVDKIHDIFRQARRLAKKQVIEKWDLKQQIDEAKEKKKKWRKNKGTK